MVRLILTLTPVVCVLAAIALSKTLDYYLYDDTIKSGRADDADESSSGSNQQQYDKVTNKSDKAGTVYKGAHPKEDKTLNSNIKVSRFDRPRLFHFKGT